MIFSLNDLKWHVDQIATIIKDNNIHVVKFLFSDSAGHIRCITLPSNKIDSNAINELMSILNIEEFSLYGGQAFLYPDSSTGFYDAFSVQQVYCVLCSIVDQNLSHIDDRAFLCQNNLIMQIECKIILELNNDSELFIDSYSDIRTEILLEGIKAGVDINSHYTTNHKNFILSFSANSILCFADCFQKLKIIIVNIFASYGKNFITELYSSKLVLLIKDDKIQFRELLFDSININPYIIDC